MVDLAVPAALQAHLHRLERELERLARRPGVEAVHDTRVAARRFRALLRGLDGYLNPPLAAQLEFELRAIGRVLAPLREADVRRAALAATCRELLRLDPELRAARLAALDEERRNERRMLRATLRAPAWAARRGRLRDLCLDEALVLPVRETLTAVLAPAIEHRWRRLQRDSGRNLDELRRLHRLRIRAKVVRYLLEEWASAARRRRRVPAVTLVRRLQNVLGELHDLLLLRAWLAGSGLPPGPLAAWTRRAAETERDLRRLLRRLAHELRQTSAGVATGTG